MYTSFFIILFSFLLLRLLPSFLLPSSAVNTTTITVSLAVDLEQCQCPPPSSITATATATTVLIPLTRRISLYQISLPLRPHHPFSPSQSSTSTTTALVHPTRRISRHLLLFLNRYGGGDECRSGGGF
ncbi:hypothetical protein A2U01_0029105 [Trifolium medium]|uniref:Secreted protein n=1 Tax=Trifolium medium TaxID=97028 RepID=A0A392P8C0_9FABA|nr:hypothetical protein [Trifolium medium]